MVMIIAITPDQIRKTGNAVLDQGHLKSRSLTDAETEIIRRSEWLRCGNPHRVGVYFAAARAVASNPEAVMVRFVAVKGGDIALVSDHDLALTAIASINSRYDANIRDYGPDGDLFKYNDGWGQGWPAAVMFDCAGADHGDFDPHHVKSANIPNTTPVPWELRDLRPVWIG